MVASDSGTKRRAPRQPRVYLVPPAQWKSARSRTCLDWSNIAAAPCSWSEQQCKPGLDFNADRRLVESSKTRFFAIARAAAFHQTLRLARRSNMWIVDGFLAAKRAWIAWDRVNQRRALTAFSCCALFGAIVVPLVSGVAHSQPEYEIRVVRSGPLPPAVLKTSSAAPVAVLPPFFIKKTREVESPAILPRAAKATHFRAPSSIALLSDVSTMDLMMPIAEPDLNIASRESLWAKVGKEFGVDPLLLRRPPGFE